MNQCVPSSALNDSVSPKFSLSLDYEVAELTCENGHIVMHGLGPPRTVGQLPSSAAAKDAAGGWEKPRGNGTLESIVSQATTLPPPQVADMLVPWFDNSGSGGGVVESATKTLDALVPGGGSSTRVGSCSGSAREEGGGERKRARVAVVPVAATCEVSSRNHSVNEVGVVGESAHVGDGVGRVDTDEMDVDTGFTSTSNPATLDDRDSLSQSQSHSRTQAMILLILILILIIMIFSHNFI